MINLLDDAFRKINWSLDAINFNSVRSRAETTGRSTDKKIYKNSVKLTYRILLRSISADVAAITIHERALVVASATVVIISSNLIEVISPEYISLKWPSRRRKSRI